MSRVSPARVFVLQQDHVVLGVFSGEQRALEDAHSLMHAHGGQWFTVSERMWQANESHAVIQVVPHDVR